MIRKLGTNEYVTWLTARAGSINFVVAASVSGPLEEAILRKALDLLPQRHPLLRARIEVQGDQSVFVIDDVPPLPLRVEVRNSDDHWQYESEKEINQSLPWSVGPLVRVVLLKGAEVSDVLITFHHVIGDATGGMYLMKDLLRLAGQITEGEAPDLKAFPLRPPLEELLPKNARGLNGLMKIAKLILRQLIGSILQHPKKLPKDGDILSEDRHCRIIHCMLSPRETEILTARCREKSTTVHGAICAAIVKAAAKQIDGESRGSRSTAISCMSAVNLRQYLNPPVGEEIGFFISMAVTTHRIGTDTRFWDLAHSVNKEIRKSIESGEPFVFHLLIDRIAPKNITPDNFVRRALKLYPSAILVTNVGHMDMQKRFGFLILEKLHFTVANKAASEIFNAAATTYRDTLVINFTHTEPALSQERATTLAEDTIKILRNVLCPD